VNSIGYPRDVDGDSAEAILSVEAGFVGPGKVSER
jgi:hypothetical protein